MNVATLFHVLRRAADRTSTVARLGAFKLLRISRLTIATVDDIIKEEVKAGRVGPVAEKLKGHAKQVLSDKITRRLVAMLLVRLGIESALASTVVGLVLPFVLEYALRRLGQTQAWARITAREDVQNLKDKIRSKLPGRRPASGTAPAV